jgi:O-antigen ligase
MPLLVVLISCLILTFSRSAFIGAFIGALITAALSLPKKTAKRLVIAGALMSVLGVIAVIVLPDISPQARYLLQHEHGLNTNAGSDDERLAALKNGFAVFMNNPEGLGLGSAGPASFRGPDALITENYYLQIAIETGVAGLIVYLLFEYLVARRLYELRNRSTTAAPLLGALCGIFLVNQFLHGWADSTTALTFWTLSAVSIGEADV